MNQNEDIAAIDTRRVRILDGAMKVELIDGLHTAATGGVGTLGTDWIVS